MAGWVLEAKLGMDEMEWKITYAQVQEQTSNISVSF